MPAGTPASKKATPRTATNAAASKQAPAAAPAAAASKAATGAAPAATASKSAASGTDKKVAATTGGSSAATAHATPKSGTATKTPRKSAEGSPTAGRRTSNSSTGTSGSLEKSTKGTKTGATARAAATTQKPTAAAVPATDTSAKKESCPVVEQQSPQVPAVARASDEAIPPAACPVAVVADGADVFVSSSNAGTKEDTPQDTGDALPSGSVVEDAPVATGVASVSASATPLICILGPPCSGKSALSDLLKQQLGLQHVCAGDLLREAAKEQGEESEIGGMIKSGGLVPDGVVINLLKKAFEGLTTRKGVVLDGFPRNAEQVKLMNEPQLYPGMVLVLKIPSEVLVRRMAARRVDLQTGEVFGDGSEPQDEEQWQRLVQRDDDKPEILQHRLDEYAEKAESILSSFTDIGGVAQADGENTKRPDIEEQQIKQQQSFKIVEVNGDRDMEQIFEEVSSMLKTSFPTIS